MNTYEINQVVYLSVAVYQLGVPTTPSSVTLSVRDPHQVVTTPAVTQGVQNVPSSAVGQFYATLTPATAGLWTYTWNVSPTQVLGSGAFQVVNVP